jgi:hypothetical protein
MCKRCEKAMQEASPEELVILTHAMRIVNEDLPPTAENILTALAAIAILSAHHEESEQNAAMN